MTKLLNLTVMLLAALPAIAQDRAAGDDSPAPQESGEKLASASKADAVASGGEAFKPPPGFKTKKRGEIVLYCMKDSTVGTRFKTEKCYNEDQLREYMLALEIQKRDIDRIRSTCATASVCAPQ